MTDRQFHAEVGFLSTASDTYPIWSDITDYVDEFTSSRGRSTELDRIEAGTASFKLANPDGRFTPGRDWLVTLDERFGLVNSVASTYVRTDLSGWRILAGVGLTTSALDGRIVSTGTGMAAAATIWHVADWTTQWAVPVTPGTTIRVTAKIKATTTGAGGGTYVYPAIAWHTGATEVSTPTGASVASNGTWVTVTSTFTVPAGVTSVCAGVGAGTTPAGNLTSEVEYIRVENRSPYAGGVKPRRPVRAYTVVDDNWLDFRLAVPRLADSLHPRFAGKYSINSGAFVAADPTSVTTVTDTPGTVYEITGPGSVVTTTLASYVYFGLPVDVIPVRAGQVINVDADIRNMNFGTVAIGVSFIPRSTGIEVLSHNDTTTAAVDGVYHRLTHSYTAPSDGRIRLTLKGLMSGTGTMRSRVVNAKIRLDGVGASTNTAASGLYPHFRGYVEKWTSTGEGVDGEAVAMCVDGFTVLSQPIASAYRSTVKAAWQAAGSPTKFHYWPCVESEDSTQANPYIGTDPLKVVKTTVPPTTVGFTTDKVITYSDGMDSSGSFTTDDTVLAQGSVLRWVASNQPYIGKFSKMQVTMWYTAGTIGTSFPTLFTTVTPDNGLPLRAYITGSTGNVTASIQPTYADGSTQLLNISTGAGTIVTGGTYFIVLTYVGSDTPGPFARVTITVNGVGVTGNIPTLGSTYFPTPWAMMFGGIFKPSGNVNFLRGSISHLTVSYGDDADTLVDSSTFQAMGGAVTESETARMNRLLSTVTWPSEKIYDTPLTTLIAARYENGADALSELQGAASAASGDLFVGTAGELIYHSRRRRMGAAYKWTLTERTGSLVFQADDSKIINTATAKRSTGLQRTIVDAASVQEYGVRALEVTRDVVSDDEVYDAAAWILHRYAAAGPRCETLTVDGQGLNSTNTGDAFALSLAGEIGDRLLLDELGPTAPDPYVGFYVEGVSLTVTADGSLFNYETVLSVSGDANSDVWVLESPISGRLDTPACSVSY